MGCATVLRSWACCPHPTECNGGAPLGCKLTSKHGLGAFEKNICLEKISLEDHHGPLCVPWLVARHIVKRRITIYTELYHVQQMVVMNSTKNQVVRPLLIVGNAGEQAAVILLAKKLD